MKTHGTDTDTGEVHFQADPEMHQGILRLAEVGYLLGGWWGGGVLLVQGCCKFCGIWFYLMKA